MREKAYCPRCRDEVSFEARRNEEAVEVDGAKYAFVVHEAICCICGSRAVYQPYRDEAALAFGDATRKAKGIVDLETVRDLPKKYHIGKRPLSLLLGWGEVTYTRFFDGQVPSKEYSDVIDLLYDDPFSYYRLLKKERLRITSHAFENSMAAVEAVLGDSLFECAKIYEIADYYCAMSGGDLTPCMLQKLTYYAQGFSLVFLDGPLFSQRPSAWADESVYGQLWHDCKETGSLVEYAVVPLEGDPCFDDSEKELLEAVFEAFGGYSGVALSKMVHKEDPWLTARGRAGAQKGNSNDDSLILEEMREYFRGVARSFGMASCHDIKTYARQSFAELSLL